MNAIINVFFKSMPWYLRDVLLYRRKFGHFPNLTNPQTFNEKVLKRKRTQCFDNMLYTSLADKYKVRNYVCAIIGSDYLVPLIYVYSDINSLKNDIFNLNHVVIKPNHGSGMISFIDDYLTYDNARKVLNDIKKWMRIDFSNASCEYHYRNINKKILVEKMIGNINDPPADYKFHIFKKRDEVFFVLQVVERRRGQSPIFTTYINNFESPCKGYYSVSEKDCDIARKALNESIKLMISIEYARIDWLIHNSKLYFSEITLTPAAGFATGLGKELDLLMGQHWELPKAI
ncbi:ATP-grasp fold amidoligase family protein [Brenneria tiliae]|uniref:ATP-grasp fold amidoligase family protein n=1 Tax=Brenneria tiliae TaxID=2914984 RepID=UPI00201488A0|nr:ATP-grasp fold amidoligase family protein [Brenneria tiliae]MCL2896802.1 hypothetical protein [Brenneria tiliae]MCL2901360.1 hypothetical protein [Brenneria tiliae]